MIVPTVPIALAAVLKLAAAAFELVKVPPGPAFKSSPMKVITPANAYKPETADKHTIRATRRTPQETNKGCNEGSSWLITGR